MKYVIEILFGSFLLRHLATMIAACFNDSAPQQLPLGRSRDGRDVFASFCPAVAQLALLLTPHLDGVATAGDVLPLPRGMSIVLNANNGQLQRILADVFARRFRRVYGYIGEIKLVLPSPFPVVVEGASVPLVRAKERIHLG